MDMNHLKELRATAYARALGGTKGRGGVRAPSPSREESENFLTLVGIMLTDLCDETIKEKRGNTMNAEEVMKTITESYLQIVNERLGDAKSRAKDLTAAEMYELNDSIRLANVLTKKQPSEKL